MLNNENSHNPLRAPYPELGNQEALDVLRKSGIYVGSGEAPSWANVQLDPTGGDVVSTAAGIACAPPAGMPGVTDVQKAVDKLGQIAYEAGAWTPIYIYLNETRAPTVSASDVTAAYIRVGDIVFASYYAQTISCTDAGEGYGAAIGGLPFQAARGGTFSGSRGGFNGLVSAVAEAVASGTGILLSPNNMQGVWVAGASYGYGNQASVIYRIRG